MSDQPKPMPKEVKEYLSTLRKLVKEGEEYFDTGEPANLNEVINEIILAAQKMRQAVLRED